MHSVIHNHCHKSLAHTHTLSPIQCWKAQFDRTPYELASAYVACISEAVALIQLYTSTVRKKMATGTFTYNALRAKTLKTRIKTQGKIVSH